MAISLLTLELDYIYKYFRICLLKLCLLFINVLNEIYIIKH